MTAIATLAERARSLTETSNALRAEVATIQRDFEAYEAQFRGFHPGSKNRHVAEYLVARAGEWITKAILVDACGVVPGAVNAAIHRLTINGVHVERRVREDKTAEYRVVAK